MLLPESIPPLSALHSLWPLLLRTYTRKGGNTVHTSHKPWRWEPMSFGRYRMLKSTGSMTLLTGLVLIFVRTSTSQLLLSFLSSWERKWSRRSHTWPKSSPFSFCQLVLTPNPAPTGNCWYHLWVSIWWEEEDLSSQPASFPSGPSPNFLCKILQFSTLSQEGEFVSAPILSKTVMPSSLRAPSSDAIKSDF